jgi:hypothetical protein
MYRPGNKYWLYFIQVSCGHSTGAATVLPNDAISNSTKSSRDVHKFIRAQPSYHYNLYMLIIWWGSDLTVCSPVWKSGQTMTDLLAHNFVNMHYRVIEVLQGSQINNPNHNRASWCVHLLCDLSDHTRLIKKDEMRKCWRAVASNENKSPYHTYMYAKNI